MGYDFLAAQGDLDSAVNDAYAKIQRLGCNLIDDKTKQRHLKLFQSYNSYVKTQLQVYECLLGINLESAVMNLPQGSAAWQFGIQLARPFISKDDAPYHVCDNPLRKDKVFRVPMMSATGWKGALRSAAVRLLAHEAKTLTPIAFAQRRLRLTHLFGNEKGWDEAADHAAYLDRMGGAEAAQLYREAMDGYTETGFLAGRLRFFPTFFDKVSVEVINPHDRETKAGKWPVYFETADIEAKGDFALLYVPFDLVGRPRAQYCAEAARDLEVLRPALQAMFFTYGFGAKTSSGYGVIDDKLSEPGQWLLNIANLSVTPAKSPTSTPALPKHTDLPRYLKAENQLADEFLNSDGACVSVQQYQAYIESQGRKYSKADQQLYDKARKWWNRTEKDLAQQKAETPTPKKDADKPSPWFHSGFSSFEEMLGEMQSAIDALLSEVKPND